MKEKIKIKMKKITKKIVRLGLVLTSLFCSTST